MDIRDYEYIVAIAEKGGISKAADHLFITQSALTKFLQRTEQKLGMELFVRKGKQFFQHLFRQVFHKSLFCFFHRNGKDTLAMQQHFWILELHISKERMDCS